MWSGAEGAGLSLRPHAGRGQVTDAARRQLPIRITTTEMRHDKSGRKMALLGIVVQVAVDGGQQAHGHAGRAGGTEPVKFSIFKTSSNRPFFYYEQVAVSVVGPETGASPSQSCAHQLLWGAARC
ncbi:hypothetical protein GCM10022407_35920 [Hymenobacter antarcticus]|uniref:Uncharacterized protein n=1 Tax=Hymenobacter antarcticus TaxID=486270 RepID=A0ABP7QU58_9BACT